MKWNGRVLNPGQGVYVYPKRQDSIVDLMKPLGEKENKGGVWVPIKNQVVNVQKPNP